jgi:AraC family transcriptional regulator
MVSNAPLNRKTCHPGLRSAEARSDDVGPPTVALEDSVQAVKGLRHGRRLAVVVGARGLPAGAATMHHISPAEAPPSVPRRPSACPDGGKHVGFTAEAARILDDVRRAMERSPEDARAAALRLVTLLTLPAEAELAGARGGLAPWQKRKVDRYLREHLEHPMRVDELAEQVPLSVSYFHRAFKEAFGRTPHAHIIRLRLELAQKLMLTTEMPLSEIALACGLADQAHLSKLFRRWLEGTPSAWRRQNLTYAQAETRSRRSTGNPSRAAGK